jgi:beta-glucosidase
VARQSVVVLHNDGVLPLDPRAGRRIAVIGPTADDPLALLGGYSFPVHLILNDQTEGTAQIVTPLAALKAVFGDAQVRYAQGCPILEERSAGAPVFPGDVAEAVNGERVSRVSQRRDGIAGAVACAKQADVAIVCVGDLAGLFQTGTVGEGSDADSLALPGVQQALLDAVLDTGTPTIVVLTGGRPYTLGGREQALAALVMAFAGGQEGGTAIAEVLAGAVEPSGRLTLSVPKSAGAMPYFYNHKLKSAGTPIALHFGSRYPFGHGLSYTAFAYDDLQLAQSSVDIEHGEIELSCRIANTGTRAGVEVAQLYVRDVLASAVRPVKELKGFARVTLAPGESARVSFHLPVDLLNFTGAAGARIVEPGAFELQVGASSADIRLRASVQVTGAVRTLGREWRMESRATCQMLGQPT